jgi:hypothetical protein
MSREKAILLAAALTADSEDGWTYRPNHGEKYSFIEIYDEDGLLAGKL